MIINDIVYGTVEINEGILIDLINSNAFQRLKDICQQGVPKGYIMPEQPNSYRYSHCIGTMLILRHLDASLEEQVAGLLHDVSHTAFSHLVDYVFGGGNKEDYQDSIHSTFFGSGSELSKILIAHGFDPTKISELKNYTLLEQEQPEMCADRFDYTLRYWALQKDMDFVNSSFDAVRKYKGTIIFDSERAAHDFAERHMVWQPERSGFGGLQYDMRVRWYIFGEVLKMGIKKGIITKVDFLKTDSYVLNRLLMSKDQKILNTLEILKSPLKFEVSETNPKVILYSKFRYVDPAFLENGEPKRLSSVDPKFNEEIERYRELNKTGLRLASIEGIELPIDANASNGILS